MLKDTTAGLVGNDRFEGFGIDIIDELSRLYGFKYNYIQWEQDYGSYDNNSNSWTWVFLSNTQCLPILYYFKNVFSFNFIIFLYSGMIGMVVNGVSSYAMCISFLLNIHIVFFHRVQTWPLPILLSIVIVSQHWILHHRLWIWVNISIK